jgi:hypothetical protein
VSKSDQQARLEPVDNHLRSIRNIIIRSIL